MTVASEKSNVVGSLKSRVGVLLTLVCHVRDVQTGALKVGCHYQQVAPEVVELNGVVAIAQPFRDPGYHPGGQRATHDYSGRIDADPFAERRVVDVQLAQQTVQQRRIKIWQTDSQVLAGIKSEQIGQ